MKNALKVERARNNMTQAELAEKVSVSRQTINSIEIGRYVPSTLLALKIAAVFNTRVDDIFTLQEDDWKWRYKMAENDLVKQGAVSGVLTAEIPTDSYQIPRKI